MTTENFVTFIYDQTYLGEKYIDNITKYCYKTLKEAISHNFLKSIGGIK